MAAGLLEGKVAIVSGIGPGMGRDISLLFAEHGADLVLGARGVEKCEAVAEEVRALGRKAEPVTLDVTDRASCEAAVETAVRSFGGVDVLVNNAFQDGNRKSFEASLAKDPDLGSWRATMDVNLWGTLAMTAATVPAMKARGGGHIVMVNSMSAKRIEPNFGAYAASKAALETASKSLAVELGEFGIRVNSIHPGYIWSEKVEWYLGYLGEKEGITGEEKYAQLAGETCLKYLPHSSEIAGSVLFFASDLSKPVTGQSLGVNCGHWIA
ncbi:MAG TPA: SDR family oxidoreductase [Acidimicrobiales bacterium]|nr:SDR family oxidoreductase [Acidimicrobiales bacterium]